MSKTKEFKINDNMYQHQKVDCWCLENGDGLKDANGVEENDEDSDWSNVAHEGLPGCVEGGVGNV